MYFQGDIVLLPFPYSDLTGKKLRPAVIISSGILQGDYIVAQITSVPKSDFFSFPLSQSDTDIPLPKPSQVRTHKIFTVHESLILQKIACLQDITRFRLAKMVQAHLDPIV